MELNKNLPGLVYPSLNHVQEQIEHDVYSTIMNMSSKSCMLDPLPTSIFKDLLPCILPKITNLVNKLLQTGGFLPEWKIATIHPLLKNPTLDLIPSNFRPTGVTFIVQKSSGTVCTESVYITL